jgi:hypothetical protein
MSPRIGMGGARFGGGEARGCESSHGDWMWDAQKRGRLIRCVIRAIFGIGFMRW